MSVFHSLLLLLLLPSETAQQQTTTKVRSAAQIQELVQSVEERNSWGPSGTALLS
jgi:hypothetical protein